MRANVVALGSLMLVHAVAAQVPTPAIQASPEALLLNRSGAEIVSATELTAESGAISSLQAFGSSCSQMAHAC